MKTLAAFYCLVTLVICGCQHSSDNNSDTYAGKRMFDPLSLEITAVPDKAFVDSLIVVRVSCHPIFDGSDIMTVSLGGVILESPFADTLAISDPKRYPHVTTKFEKNSQFIQEWRFRIIPDLPPREYSFTVDVAFDSVFIEGMVYAADSPELDTIVDVDPTGLHSFFTLPKP